VNQVGNLKKEVAFDLLEMLVHQIHGFVHVIEWINFIRRLNLRSHEILIAYLARLY
jgi:hypothetical protein